MGTENGTTISDSEEVCTEDEEDQLVDDDDNQNPPPGSHSPSHTPAPHIGDQTLRPAAAEEDRMDIDSPDEVDVLSGDANGRRSTTVDLHDSTAGSSATDDFLTIPAADFYRRVPITAKRENAPSAISDTPSPDTLDDLFKHDDFDQSDDEKKDEGPSVLSDMPDDRT